MVLNTYLQCMDVQVAIEPIQIYQWKNQFSLVCSNWHSLNLYDVYMIPAKNMRMRIKSNGRIKNYFYNFSFNMHKFSCNM